MLFKILLICIHFNVFFLARAQDTLRGVKNGIYISKSPNGQVLCKGYFLNGLRNGDWEIYQDGVIYCSYKNGLKEGLHKKVENNITRNIWNFRGGKREGEQKDFDQDGKIAEVYYILNNQLEGSCKKYNSQGILLSETNYHKGKRHGKSIEYKPDGSKNLEYEFKNGIAFGAYAEYDGSGNIKIKGQLTEGKRDGTWSFTEGGEAQTVIYKDGVILEKK